MTFSRTISCTQRYSSATINTCKRESRDIEKQEAYRGVGFVLPREGLEPSFSFRLLALVVPGQGVARLAEGLFLSGESAGGSRESGWSGRARAAAGCR